MNGRDHWSRPLLEKSGDVLLSQGISAQVPSALTGLTSVFGMGTGVSPSLSPPKKFAILLLGASSRSIVKK